MPKWQTIRSANWAKELLMTFAGATLSIILTFGTAHILDEKQQREDGRQTAMMVIHDIENSAELFRQYVQKEEQLFNTSQYVRENKQNMDAVSADSLLAFVTYVTASADHSYVFDDSSERTFLSSQEAWKNIDNAAFIDAVQDFYHNRRVIYSMLNKDYLFAKPISNGDYYQSLLQSPEGQQLDTAFWVDCAKRYLERRDVKMYVDYSFARRRYFNEYADTFRSMANRCKFMMGISDEELAQYVQNKSRTGKPLTKKKLIGKWKLQTADDLEAEREYRSDHTYTTSFMQYMSYSYYTGQIVLKCTMNGTWELRGDSLYTEQHPDYAYEFDRSQIHYLPEQEDAINHLLEMWKQSVIISLDQMTKEQGEQRKSVFASIDASGNKIEMRNSEGVVYLTRFDKP
jgi:hypothetical protein